MRMGGGARKDRLSSMCAVVIGMAGFATPVHSQAPAVAEPPRRSIALTIHSKQKNFRVGDEIRIQVAWQNTSDKPVLAAQVIPTAETSYKVFVEDDKGNPAAETVLGRRIR